MVFLQLINTSLMRLDEVKLNTGTSLFASEDHNQFLFTLFTT